jgi:hypothetical protein
MQDRRVVYCFDEFGDAMPVPVHPSLTKIEELEPITAPQSTASFLDRKTA